MSAPDMAPTPEQIAAMQQQIAMEAQKRGLTPQQYQAQQRAALEEEARKAGLPLNEYINRIKQQAWEQHQRQQQQLAQQQAANGQAAGSAGQQVPIQPGPPNPKAIALAKWLQGQDLKARTCVLNGQRKEMFKVKRALRALQSEAYVKAQKKNAELPTPPPDAQAAAETLKLLPLSLLALRVSKIDPHEGHNHASKQKHVKGLWTVKVEQQQDIFEHLHYVWLYDGPQWRMKLYAAGALTAIMTVVMFPLWPVKLRLGVWYLSMAFLGLIGLFFAMAIVRLLLFCITVVTMPRGFWLYPNLFEDVGFFDSFRPVWAWQEEKGKKPKKSKTKNKDGGKAIDQVQETVSKAGEQVTAGISSAVESIGGIAHAPPKVEEVEDD